MKTHFIKYIILNLLRSCQYYLSQILFFFTFSFVQYDKRINTNAIVYFEIKKQLFPALSLKNRF